MPLAFSTKAGTLTLLQGQLHSARIMPLVCFTVAEWQNSRADCLTQVTAALGVVPMIVRSSCQREDGAGESNAGAFLSLPNVVADRLESAVEQVIASYGEAVGADEVLIQPMLIDVAMSGVAFSQDPNTGSHYIVVNYETKGDTTAVTGGHTDGLRTVYSWKYPPVAHDSELSDVVALISELDILFGGKPIDIEFARDLAGTLYLFQVRPLAIRHPTRMEAAEQSRTLATIATKIDSTNRPHPYLKGRHTVYGIMPDWNPAEIVGVRPRPLALSLYREIITDSIWAYQRHNYGYQNLRSFPLLVDFQGLPYIDVRVSFNSFIPADVPAELAHRLVDYYIDCLVRTPTLHDKVEFEIVLSCYSFDLEERLQRLRENGFTQADCELLSASLNRLTNRIIHRDTGLWRRDTERIETLTQRHATITTAELDTVSRIYWLLEDCKRYGTLPFAGLARAGFIAVQILRSLVTSGVLSEDDRTSFMSGLDTISTRMGRDLASLDHDAFLKKYGHLRPGTYDILSPRYDEAPDVYFDWNKPPAQMAEEKNAFALSLNQMRTIGKLLDQHKLEHDVVGLFDFLEAGIRGREYSKFVFTRSLSDALSLIGRFGIEYGFSLDDMSYLDIGAIYKLHASSGDVRAALAGSIAKGRESHAMTRAITLPPLITSGADVWSFEMPATEPNFITQLSTTGPVAHIGQDSELDGKIAMITNADPGFDWIFSRGIKGFITAYGGVNSHMAIRAAELNLPAVIGAGEVLYAKWSSAHTIEIDAVNRQVRVLR